MHNNIPVTVALHPTDDEDQASTSLFKLQEEKKSLFRTISSEEVVFEKDNSSELNFQKTGDNSNNEHVRSSCSSTMSLENSWSVLDEEHANNNPQLKKDDKPAASIHNNNKPLPQPQQQQRNHLGMSYEEAALRKRQELAKNEAKRGKKLAASSGGPSVNNDDQHPKDDGAYSSDDEQDRKPAAIDKSKPHQNGHSPEAFREEEMPIQSASDLVASLPSADAPPAAKKKAAVVAPSNNNLPPPLIPLEMQQKLAMAQKSPSKTDKITNNGKQKPRLLHNNPTPASAAPTTVTEGKPSGSLTATSPTASTSPTTSKPSPHLKQPPPSVNVEGVAASSSHARLQGNAHDSPPRARVNTNSPMRSPVPVASTPGASRGLRRQSDHGPIPGSSPRGLRRQSGSHHIQQGLSRQSGSHHLKEMPVLPVQDFVEPAASREGSFATTLSTKTGPSHHAAHAAMMNSQSPAHHQVPDSHLMALYQNPLVANGIHHANSLHRQHFAANQTLRRHSSKPSGGPPNTIVVAPRGLRSFMAGKKGLPGRGPITTPVTPELRQKAEQLNLERQQRNQKKMKQYQQRKQLQQQQQQALTPQQLQQHNLQLEQHRQKKEQALLGSKGSASPKGSEGDDLDASILSDGLAGDSIKDGPSFALAHQVLQASRRPSDPKLEVEMPSGSQRRRRQSVMQKDVSKMAIADVAAVNNLVSEPGGSLPAAAALRDKRRSLLRDRSSQVMQNTAALQSTRTGVSSLAAPDDEDAKVAVAKIPRKAAKWSRGRIMFPGTARSPLTNDSLELNNAISTHSSIGWNSASYRSVMEASAHLKSSPEMTSSKHNNGLHNYNPQLKPHVESESVLSNASASNLDASSVVSPPSREQMRQRHASRAANGPAGRRGSAYVPDSASVASSRVSATQGRRSSMMARSTVNDGASVASSRVSAANHSRARRLSRQSMASGPGLSSGAPGRRGSKAGEIPIPKCMDPARAYILMRHKQEKEKESSELWGGILSDQNDIIMELAKKLSMEENQKKVHEQQQAAAAASREREAKSHALSSTDLSGLIDRNMSGKPTLPVKPAETDEMDPAVLMAILESERASQPAPSRDSDEMDPAILMAMQESQNDLRHEPMARVDSDRELERVLAMSRAEAVESDRKRHAKQLGESLLKRELSAPLTAALESDAEVAGTIDVALRLSKQEYEHEMSKRLDNGAFISTATGQTRDIAQGSSRGARKSNRDSLLEYSVSTQHGGTADQSFPSLVMPPVNEGESIERAQSREGGSAADQGNDQALALALALSKVGGETSTGAAETGNDEVPWLSQEESMAYAIELSRRAPGAHSQLGTPSSIGASASRNHSASPSHLAPIPPPARFHQPSPPAYEQPPAAGPAYIPQPYQQPFSPAYHYPYQQAYCPQPYPPPYPPPYPQPYQHPYPPPFQQPYPPPYPQPYQQPYPPPQPYPQPYPPPYPQPYQQPFNDSRSVGTSTIPASLPRVASYATPASLSHAASSDEDEALRMALAISRGDACGAGDSKSHSAAAARSVASTASLADDESTLALALERSRTER